MAEKLRSIRHNESTFLRRRAFINALNFASNFAIAPLCAFVTFSVAKAMGRTFALYRYSPYVYPRCVAGPMLMPCSTLQRLLRGLAPDAPQAMDGKHRLPSRSPRLRCPSKPFAAPSLLQALFFVRAVETVTELRVSIRRLDRFLAQPEPAPSTGADSQIDGPNGRVVIKGKARAHPPPVTHVSSRALTCPCTYPWTLGDFDWAALPEGFQASAAAPDGSSGQTSRATLRGIDFQTRPGELVALVGLVGQCPGRTAGVF